MKKITLKLSAVLTASALVLFGFTGGKLTLKEKIDQAKEVKVYFVYNDIFHDPDILQRPTQPGTSIIFLCNPFKETTKLPEGYKSASKKILKMLNEGFKTTAFVEGDLNSVPTKKTKIGSIEVKDWVKHGEQLSVTVTISGAYKVNNSGAGSERKRVNSMFVKADLKFFEMVDGKYKNITLMSIAYAASKAKTTEECKPYDYFVENFPSASLVEPFNSSIEEKVAGFIEKQMAKYEKAMKKKK
ncbi:MAG: hypothetical protein FVQ77_07200 [Cytophagales bacterium]|nr:hypothetical protein [Cytophagales bacterium]